MNVVYKYNHKLKYRDLIEILIEKSNLCFWCGHEVKIYPFVEGENSKDDMATIDHLKSRFFREKKEIVGKVLCCYKCNQDRSFNEQKKLTKKKVPVDNSL